MALILTGTCNISFVPDGANQMSVPTVQTLQVSINANVPATAGFTAAPIVVTGTLNNPTTGNLNTAAVAFGAAISTLLQANVNTITGWGSGGN